MTEQNRRVPESYEAHELLPLSVAAQLLNVPSRLIRMGVQKGHLKVTEHNGWEPCFRQRDLAEWYSTRSPWLHMREYPDDEPSEQPSLLES